MVCVYMCVCLDILAIEEKEKKQEVLAQLLEEHNLVCLGVYGYECGENNQRSEKKRNSIYDYKTNKQEEKIKTA